MQDQEFTIQVEQMAGRLQEGLQELHKRLVGQRNVGERLLTAILVDGHVLLEGLPGLAKTTAIKALAEVAALPFARMQFTPDLLPADLVGTQIFNPKSGDFHTRKGPIFTNLLLADEINRSPPKVQSALLEGMQERQVTLGGETQPLPDPFLVLATQNPIEQEGTYPLPEAQTDRFLFKVIVGYGSRDEELEILKRMAVGQPEPLRAVLDRQCLLDARNLVSRLHVADKARHYIVDVVLATRQSSDPKLKEVGTWIEVGASPRATLSLERAARAHAFLQGRPYVLPQDIRDVAYDVLRHRILMSYEAQAQDIKPEAIIERVLDVVPVP